MYIPDITDGKCVIFKGVTEIEHGAFFHKEQLREIKLPASLETIASQAFEGCCNLMHIEIPEGTKKIEHGAFSGCSSLKKIRIPKSVTSIGNLAFAECSGIDTIEVDEDNPIYKSVSNCCLTKDGRTLVFGCKTSVIPDGVERIEECAFYGCRGLKSVVIPDSVRSIGEWAFIECGHLTSINIPASLKEVEICAFRGASIKDIYIAAQKPEDCADLTEALKENNIKKITLHVPDGSEYAYRRHPFFKRFKDIR